MLVGGLLDLVDAFFGGDAFVAQDDAMLYDEVLEVPERRFDAGGFAPPPRFSRAEGLPQKPPPMPRFDPRYADLRDDVEYVRERPPPPPPREVVVEVEAEEEDAALEEEEAAAAASLLVLASAAALCLASLSLAVLALGAARRRQREREELAAFKANYAPMLSENEQA